MKRSILSSEINFLYFIYTISVSCLMFKDICAYSGCPDFNVLAPCSCIHRPGTNVLLCAGLKSSAAILEVFNHSLEWSFHTFFICQSSVNYIPSNSLTNKKFKTILIANTNMTSLFDKEPDFKNELEILHINNIRFEDGIGWNSFPALKKLEYFNLQFAAVPNLEEGITRKFPASIKHLRFSNTKTKELGDRAFENLKQLTEIKISNSEIKILKRSMFPSPSKVVIMDFSANQIESLPEDMFIEMPDLRVVSFTSNKLTQISQQVFGILRDFIQIISVEGNPLKCDCSLEWLVLEERKFLDGSCAEPESKRGVPINNLTKTDLNYCAGNSLQETENS